MLNVELLLLLTELVWSVFPHPILTPGTTPSGSGPLGSWPPLVWQHFSIFCLKIAAKCDHNHNVWPQPKAKRLRLLKCSSRQLQKKRTKLYCFKARVRPLWNELLLGLPWIRKTPTGLWSTGSWRLDRKRNWLGHLEYSTCFCPIRGFSFSSKAPAVFFYFLKTVPSYPVSSDVGPEWWQKEPHFSFCESDVRTELFHSLVCHIWSVTICFQGPTWCSQRSWFVILTDFESQMERFVLSGTKLVRTRCSMIHLLLSETLVSN